MIHFLHQSRKSLSCHYDFSHPSIMSSPTFGHASIKQSKTKTSLCTLPLFTSFTHHRKIPNQKRGNNYSIQVSPMIIGLFLSERPKDYPPRSSLTRSNIQFNHYIVHITQLHQSSPTHPPSPCHPSTPAAHPNSPQN